MKHDTHDTEQVTRLRPIPGYPGYEITPNGQVWSAPRYLPDGRYWAGRWLKPSLCQGYPFVVMGKGNTRQVHRLVLEAYVGPCPPGQQCRHLNGIRTDNRLSNLCWGTRAENVSDRTKHGKTYQGEQHSNAKLTEQQVKQIIYIYRTGLFNNVEIAQQYNVQPEAIGKIVNKQRWKHIWR